MSDAPKKHRYAKEIKSWADGAQVEEFDELTGLWVETTTPDWSEKKKFRAIPPGPKLRWMWATENGRSVSAFLTDEEAQGTGFKIKLKWTETEFQK